jgi:uncharacterized small protein (DUF1192 family)
MTRAGIDRRRMHRPLGPKKTAQRIGVSRLLDEAARNIANEDLSVLSSFDDTSLPFCSGWEFAEHEYRNRVGVQRREIHDEILRLYADAELERRLAVFRAHWLRNRSERELLRPDFNNF